MMGSGKSSVGRVLNDLLDDFNLIDTDKGIEKSQGQSIDQLFSMYGEKYFRNLETELLNKIASTNTILATGGGMPFYNDNWKQIESLGTTFFLCQPLSQLVKNIVKSKESRPLFNESDFRKLYEVRLPIYEQSAHTINCENLHQTQIAKKIIKLYNKA